MSGGYFDHDQYRIGQIADKIEDEIRDHEHPNTDEYNPDDTYKRAVNILRLGQVCAHRIDWLLSGDDGEETFHKRLLEDLTKYAEELK
jgi:hypothetical protein